MKQPADAKVCQNTEKPNPVQQKRADPRKWSQDLQHQKKKVAWLRISVYFLFCGLLVACLICEQITYPWATVLIALVVFVFGIDLGANHRILCPWLFG